MQHIPRRHRAQRAQLLHVDLGPPVRQDLHHRLLPIRAITQQAQIAERLLRTAQLALPLRELVAEGDEQAAEALALILRQRQDTRHIIPLRALLLLAEIADQMTAVPIARRHAIEQERIDVVIQRLMIQKQFAQQTQVPTPASLAAPVDLEEADVVVAVDLVAGRVQERAFGAVALEGPARAQVREAVFADVQHVFFGEGERVGGEVPGLHFVLAHLHAAEVAHARDFGLVLRHAAAGAELFDLFFARVGGGGGGVGGFGGGGGVGDVDQVEVFVVGGFGGGGGGEGEVGGEDGDGGAAGGFVLFAAGEGGAAGGGFAGGVGG